MNRAEKFGVSVLVAALALCAVFAYHISSPDYAAHDARQAAAKRATEIREQNREGQIALIQFCAKKGGVPIVLYIGTDDVRLTDCKFPFPTE